MPLLLRITDVVDSRSRVPAFTSTSDFEAELNYEGGSSRRLFKSARLLSSVYLSASVKRDRNMSMQIIKLE